MKQLLTINDVQERLRCSRRAVYRLIGRGLLRRLDVPCVGVRFDVSDLEALLSEPPRLTPPAAPAKRPQVPTRVHFDGIL